MPRDDATLLDIVNAARLTQTFIQDMTEAFLVDLKTQSAVLHQITVIGEAVKRLSQAFRERHPILPWPLMAGMRDHRWWSRRRRPLAPCSGGISPGRSRHHVSAPHTSGGSVTIAVVMAERRE